MSINSTNSDTTTGNKLLTSRKTVAIFLDYQSLVRCDGEKLTQLMMRLVAYLKAQKNMRFLAINLFFLPLVTMVNSSPHIVYPKSAL
jgi:hypothetical protein